LIHLVLLFVTVITTLFWGALMEGANPFERFSDITAGIPFSVTLMAILGIHELGHYFLSRKHGTNATLPYFMPSPILPGTFGAFIKIKSPIQNRRMLLDIGAAGPIAGFVIAIIAIAIGLDISEVRKVADEGVVYKLGEPLIFTLISRLIIGKIPEGFDIYVSSVAFAGWFGIFVTGLNLLPIGQLDGGHVLYALIGKKHKIIARIAFFALFPLAYFWIGWLFLAFLALIVSLNHPPPVDEEIQLDLKRKIIGFACIVIFILSFTFVPLSVSNV